MSRSAQQRWQRLAKLAAATVHHEERALGAANQQLSLAEGRERLLRDHAQALKQDLDGAAMPIRRIAMHQRFGQRLASAIDEQQRDRAHRLHMRQQARSNWLAARKRQQVFEKLAQNAQKQQTAKEEQTERRQLDEFRRRPHLALAETKD